jgi:prophage regulatory protein
MATNSLGVPTETSQAPHQALTATPAAGREKGGKRRKSASVPPALCEEGDRLLPMKSVVAITSWSRTSINRLIEKGEFPAPLKLGPQKIAFRETEVREWVASRQRRVSATPETDDGAHP